MWLIVGLGNPGSKYDKTRHNIGFMVADRLAQRAGFKLATKKFRSHFGSHVIAGQKALLSKPQTYMNCSGDSVQPMAAFYKLKSTQILVIHDELDLPFGCVRIKQSGGSAGHNGLRSVSARLGGGDYPRVRVGIGRPTHGDNVTAHVLGAFNSVERASLDAVVERTCDAVEMLVSEGVVAAMNRVNGQPLVC